MNKPREEEKESCGEITIGFNNLSTHEDIVQQVVDKLWLSDFASKEEIIEHLKMADILYKNNAVNTKKHKRGGFMREEEKEIERALAGGKVYQIREVKKLLDKALSSQLKEVLGVINSFKLDTCETVGCGCNGDKRYNEALDDLKAEVEKLV